MALLGSPGLRHSLAGPCIRGTLPRSQHRAPSCLRHCSAPQGSCVARAKRGQYEDDDEVSFDDNSWNGAGTSSNSITGVLGQAWGFASGTADRLVAFGMDLAPEGTSRPVVETVVRGGLTLLAITLVRSILNAALLVGSIILGIYLFTRFNKDSASGGHGRQPGSRPKRRGRMPGALPSGRADSDLSEVWFERDPARQRQRDR